VRAYATNSAGTAYGSQEQFTTSGCLPPTVSTTAISNVRETSAQGGGTVTDNGGATVTERGVCWSIAQDPSIANDCTNDGTGTGSFTSYLTGLSTFTTYYARAYATNSAGTSYGSQVSFTTSTVTDYDGNVYKTVVIGTQTWMTENLKTTHFPDGTEIPLVESTSAWDALSTTDKAYCWYDNSTSYGDTYGALYTWAAAIHGAESSDTNPSGIQGVCPDGWHLPSDGEWKQLEMFLGMSPSEADNTSWRGTDEGGKLKETGTTHWYGPNTGATNESGFTALPGGERYNGSFQNIGLRTALWTATETEGSFAWWRSLVQDNSQVFRSSHYKNDGSSIRCVRD